MCRYISLTARQTGKRPSRRRGGEGRKRASLQVQRIPSTPERRCSPQKVNSIVFFNGAIANPEQATSRAHGRCVLSHSAVGTHPPPASTGIHIKKSNVLFDEGPAARGKRLPLALKLLIIRSALVENRQAPRSRIATDRSTYGRQWVNRHEASRRGVNRRIGDSPTGDRPTGALTPRQLPNWPLPLWHLGLWRPPFPPRGQTPDLACARRWRDTASEVACVGTTLSAKLGGFKPESRCARCAVLVARVLERGAFRV